MGAVSFFLARFFADVFLVLPMVIILWAIFRWSDSSPRISKPRWRYYLAVAAAALAGASTALWLISIVWARVIGGFGFYDPVLLRFYRWGALTAMGGLLVSLAGKGKLRWPTCGVSVLMTLLWFAAAMGE
jgi:hypothetical protein